MIKYRILDFVGFPIYISVLFWQTFFNQAFLEKTFIGSFWHQIYADYLISGVILLIHLVFLIYCHRLIKENKLLHEILIYLWLAVVLTSWAITFFAFNITNGLHLFVAIPITLLLAVLQALNTFYFNLILQDLKKWFKKIYIKLMH